MAAVIMTPSAQGRLEQLIESHALPTDTRARLRRSLGPLMEFPLIGAPLPAKATVHKRPVVEVTYLIDLRLEIWENLERVIPPASDTGMATIGLTPLDPDLVGGELHLGIHQRQIGIEVASVEGVDYLVKQRGVKADDVRARIVKADPGASYMAIAPRDPIPSSQHIMGTLRFGSDPATSVCDPNGKLWDLGNLYAGDGALFPTSSGHNPTMTIVTLALRVGAAMVNPGSPESVITP